MRYSSSRYRRKRMSANRPIVAFLLVSSFGILFAGCSAPADTDALEEFSFTAQDVERFREEVARDDTGTGSAPVLSLGSGAEIEVANTANQSLYDAIRSSSTSDTDLLKVTNTFLNLRSSPQVTASSLLQLQQGDIVSLLAFENAAWAHVRTLDGVEGYASLRYLSQMVSEEQLSSEKEQYQNMYFVDFAFLNVRTEPDSQAEKIGELPGQTLLEPLSIQGQWARISFEDREAYVSSQYLTPFLPKFLVRQETFTLPVLHYRADEEGVSDAMVLHIAALQDAGYTLSTFSDFAGLLVSQQERDVRLEPKTVIIAISALTAESLDDVTSVLRASTAAATLFLRTADIGIDDITEQDIATLSREGFDLQSAAHSGDDLRSLTNAQLQLELQQSKSLLEEQTGADVLAVAYPSGGTNDRVLEHAAKAGYLFGLQADGNVTFSRNDLLTLPTVSIAPDMSSDELLTLLRQE